MDVLGSLMSQAGVVLEVAGGTTALSLTPTALWAAAMAGRAALVDRLLSGYDADVAAATSEGQTLLHLLCHWGGAEHSTVASSLVRSGAPTRALNTQGHTALDEAVMLANPHMIQLLSPKLSSQALQEKIAQWVQQQCAGVALLRGAGLPPVPACPSTGSFQDVTDWCATHQLKFVDSSFKPCLASLQGSQAQLRNAGSAVWRRLGEFESLPGRAAATPGPLGDPLYVASLPAQLSSCLLKADPRWGVYLVRVRDMHTAASCEVLVDDWVPVLSSQPAALHCSEFHTHLYLKAAAKLAGSFAALRVCPASTQCPDSLEQAVASVQEPAQRLQRLLGLPEEASLSDLEGMTPVPRQELQQEESTSQVLGGAELVGGVLEFEATEASVVQVSCGVEPHPGEAAVPFTLSLCAVQEQAWELLCSEQGTAGAKVCVQLPKGAFVAVLTSRRRPMRVGFKVDSEGELRNVRVVEQDGL